MHFVVLGSPTSWYLRDLTRAAGDRHQISSATFRQLVVAAEPNGQRCSSSGLDLTKVDALIVRTMPPGSLEQVVFRMDVLGRLEAEGVAIVNPPRAIEAAVDKYLATARLAAAGLRVPRTVVCQTAEDALAGFAELGSDVVLKPLFGSEGRGITRLTDAALAERAFRMLEGLGAVLYLQEFIEHEGFDLRLLVIGEHVLGMRRRNPHDWRTNISRGAMAEAFSPDSSLVELARRAAEVIGAPLAGVDVLPGRNGEFFLIEVNAVPGWQALSTVSTADVASLVLDLVATMTTAKRRSC
ncbi:MAG TPA: RimK family alpha-L-glutamate ligase [Pirellulales bacterium]|jgi:ribosomal protein S6--L-glutamate ligase